MSDLDARVAALMEIICEWRDYETSTKDLDQAIRAELQKPALHEPVSEEEILALFFADEELRGHGVYQKIAPPGTTESGVMLAVDTTALRVWRLAEKTLQGRVKPALHEPVIRQAIDALSAAEFNHPSAADEIGNQCQAARKRLESFLQGRAKPAQEEITDAERGAIAYELTKRIVIDMPTARAVVDAAIRAGKGEKT